MRGIRMFRVMKLAAAGVVLLQVGACNFALFNEWLQTVFLGVTAAGAVAILQNI